MPSPVTVRLHAGPDRSYPVHIQPGLLRRLPRLLVAGWKDAAFFLISDETVSRLYARELHRGIAEAGRHATLITFPDGERSKSAATLNAIHTALLSGGINRSSVVVAVGGGVAGDLAGFAAATVLRGVPFVQVPTSLLAQVDSSVGGKTGIDHPLGKNLIGAFHQPAAVYIDPSVLQTLPPEQFRNGLAEVAKIGIALDAGLVRLLALRPPDARAERRLTSVIRRAVGLKALVVSMDERDRGVRTALNLGHTLGHALESSEDYHLPHGLAVAAGIAGEAEIARRMGILPDADHARIIALLRLLRLPRRMSPVRHPARFRAALARDKKSGGDELIFTLPAGIGAVALGVPVPMWLVEKTVPGLSRRRRP